MLYFVFCSLLKDKYIGHGGKHKTVFCVSNSPLIVVLIVLIMSYAFQFKLQQYIMTLRSLQILHQSKLLVLESMILNTSLFVKTN